MDLVMADVVLVVAWPETRGGIEMHHAFVDDHLAFVFGANGQTREVPVGRTGCAYPDAIRRKCATPATRFAAVDPVGSCADSNLGRPAGPMQMAEAATSSPVEATQVRAAVSGVRDDARSYREWVRRAELREQTWKAGREAR